MTRALTILTCGALAVTSACTEAPTERVDAAGAQELVALCMDQTQAPGSYNWNFTGRLPVAAALVEFGGTREGASMVNACVRQNAKLFETTATPTVATAASAPDPVLSDPEPVAPTGAQAPRTTPAVAPPESQQPVVHSTEPRSLKPGCPPGVSGLYRGTIIC